ncbi:hypothetical protein [Neptuniibacter sp. QD37_11]|uniref:hypothetical protein n=1 Tax=Neptuniibacter sp. QD37_11 TaxID=3398209 RepID=UPI0039F5CF01
MTKLRKTIEARMKELRDRSPHEDEWDCPFDEKEYFTLQSVLNLLDGEEPFFDSDNHGYYKHPAIDAGMD